MGVYTFVCKKSGADWSCQQLNGDLGLEWTGDSTFDLQRTLVEVALSAETGPVQSSFTFVTPSSAVFQVVVNGGGSFAGKAEEEDDYEEDVMAIYDTQKKAEESDETDMEGDIMDGLFGGD